MTQEQPQFGCIRIVRGYLHIDCRIYKERVRMTSGLADTPNNRKDLVLFLNGVGVALKDRSFRFREFFPHAEQLFLDKFASIETKLFGAPLITPNSITLEEYAKSWLAEESNTLPETTRRDYAEILRSRINPMIGHLTFTQLTSTCLKQFVRNLKHTGGERTGNYLSAKRMRNILNLLRKIFTEANLDYKWMLPDPFPPAYRRIKKIESLFDDEGEIRHKPREVWLLSEWRDFMEHVPVHYRPLFEAMRMGLIFSELKGLQKDCVHDDHIEVRRSISRGVMKNKGKTAFRTRKIKLTAALKASIAQAMATSKTEHVFTMEDGTTILNYTTMLKRIWGPALKAAGLPHRNMYSLRHTFVGWMVLLGIDSSRLKHMAGHSSRSGLTEDTYGDFREGLLAEREAILNHLGRDTMEPEEFKRAFPTIYMQEQGIEPTTPTSGMTHESIRLLASMVATEIRADQHEPTQVAPFQMQQSLLVEGFKFGRADGYADAHTTK